MVVSTNLQNISAARLISTILSNEKQDQIHLILSDNPLFKRLASNQIIKITNKAPVSFEGKTAVAEAVNHKASGNLFDLPQGIIIDLTGKITQSQWNLDKKILSKIPIPLDVPCFIFGSTSQRQLFKNDDFSKGTQLFLCYDPSAEEKEKCTHSLLAQYPSLNQKEKKEKDQICSLALQHYGWDLFCCDMHFERMEKGQLEFYDALAGQPETNGFHVVEALAKGDIFSIEQSILNCALCGEDAFSIFMAVTYFVKQVANVIGALEQGVPLKTAFMQTHIPFPAQGKIEKSLRILSAEKIYLFLQVACEMEIELKLQKNPHQYLATELITWLSK